jgi:hypothetical protein
VCGKCFPDRPKTIKTFSAKKKCHKNVFAEKNVTDFFSNFRIKKILILKMNIFLDFSFLKKQ